MADDVVDLSVRMRYLDLKPRVRKAGRGDETTLR